jgi:ADP-L-glycero-D-manno-heptose 6-epimerase
MNILITGCKGLIGSKLFHEFPNSLGLEVSAGEVFLVDQESHHIKMEPTQQSFIETLTIQGISAVIHLGAITSTAERSLQKFKHWNTDFSKNLIDACLATNTDFIFASSQAVYGKLWGVDEDVLIDPPKNPYADSKFKTEQYLIEKLIHGEQSQTLVALRLSNVFGLNELHKGSMASTVYQFWDSVKEQNPIKIFTLPDKAKGSQARDFISVDEVAHVISLILSDQKPVRGIYNLGSGFATEFHDLAKIVMRVAGGKSVIEYVEMPKELCETYQWLTSANISKLQERLNLPNFEKLESQIKRTFVDNLNEI